MEGEDTLPTITSFGSYAGLKKQQFASNCIVVISASTSGHLESKLISEKFIDRSRIVTLFYLGEETSTGRAICHLRRHGFELIKNEHAATCAWCRRSVPLITLTDEQFVPENPHVNEEMLNADDAPSWLSSFFKMVVGKNLISCNKSFSLVGATQRREIFISTLLYSTEGPSVSQRLETTLRRILPASLRRIVHLDDDESIRLASLIKTQAVAYLPSDRKLEMFPAAQLDGGNITEDFDGATLVVASAVSTGRTILAISQMLRPRLRDKADHYLIGLGRTRNEKALRDLRSNLQYCDGPGGFDLSLLDTIYLPGDSPLHGNAWEQESDFLDKARSVIGPGNVEYKRIIDERLEQLREPAGLQSNLFWLTNNGIPLMLDPNFAFWKFDYESSAVTQADVYATIAMILHSRREGGGDKHGWLQHEHHRVILSPFNFSRFNDGVIQSSLLRAARIEELDYAVDERISTSMTGIMGNIIDFPDRSSGEALAEFLLALAMQRLRLAPVHLGQLLSRLAGKALSPPVKMLCAILESSAAGTASIEVSP